jgi:hypothetical protein
VKNFLLITLKKGGSTMNKHLITAAIGLLTIGMGLTTQAQIKIGGTAAGTTDAGAHLQIGDNPATKGLLLPRVQLVATTSWGLAGTGATAQNGMFVYNTNTVADVTPGVYYWYNNKWVRLIDVPASPSSSGGTVFDFTAGNLLPLFTTNVATSTTTPALSFNLSNAAATTVFGNNTGATAAPNFFPSGNLAIAGDVTGTLGASTVTRLQGRAIAATAPAANQVLTYTGTQWAPANAAVTYFNAPLGATPINIPSTATNTFLYTGTAVTLPPGKWAVNVSMLMTKSFLSVIFTGATESWWLRTTFCADAVSPKSASTIPYTPDMVGPPFMVSGLLPPSCQYSMLEGTFIINNTSGANKTYYYFAGAVGGNNPSGTLQLFGAKGWDENQITYQAVN